MDGGAGNTQGFGGLFQSEAAEEAHFDDGALLLVELGECGEGVIEGDNLDTFARRDMEAFVKGERFHFSAALFTVFGAGVIDQDAAHDLRGDALEVGAVLPADVALVHQFEEGFMDDAGALEGVAGALAAEVGGGEQVEFGVDQRHELVEGSAVAVAPADEQGAHVVGRRLEHRS